MLLNTSEAVPFLMAPEFTGAKRVRAWSTQREPEPEFVSGFELDVLRRKHGGDAGYRPFMREATFSVPYGQGMRADTLDRLVKEKVNTCINAMSKHGFDVDTTHKIQVYPGMCPSVDLVSQLPLLGQRDLIIRGWFRCRRPKTERFELPSELFAPIHAAPRAFVGAA